MSKKTALIGAIVIMLVWFCLWGFGYRYLNQQVSTASTRGFVQSATSYLSNDNTFADEYGLLTDMKTVSSAPVNNGNEDTMEYYMDFTCITAKGEYSIRIFQTWDDAAEKWVLRYEELK